MFWLLLGLCATACAAETKEVHPVSASHPGARPYPTGLTQKLAHALAAKGSDYEPRTHHLVGDGTPVYTNRLILEDSPYLQQHAHNPVDWFPWGEEAFERARQEDKPVFLSIGYSTCHWCHVMERESFENEEIARLMNEYFVCIKLDRERRPDIDEFYMTAVQLLTGRGGWPMSSFLTADGKPFHGGTYYPPDRFSSLLENVSRAWREQRGQIYASADRIAASVLEATASRGEAQEVGQAVLQQAVTQTLARHDRSLGGFGRAPKFPHEPEILFLLSQAWRHGDTAALAAATHSLDAMARGGIYDQVGGGFHRYSTDNHWLVPHFEKMLYNQAHLSRAYLAAYRLTGEPFFARVAGQTFDYILREMTTSEGAFYSATDADSEGEEGIFFVWTPEGLREVLNEEEAALAIELWSVTPGGNFEHRNILHLERSLSDLAAAKGLTLAEFLESVDSLRETLWQAREERQHPLRDDKILSAWNGMMITALAAGSQHLGEKRYGQAAARAAEFLWRHNHREKGGLWRVRLGDSSSVDGLQEDYAYLAEAFLALFDLTGEEKWLERAQQLADTMLEDFWDHEAGGFFMGGIGADPLLIGSPKSPRDGAIPSGNSVAVRVLAQLARRTGIARYGEHAEATVRAFSSSIRQRPGGYSYLLLGLDELLHGAVGELQYGANGKVRATARVTTEGVVVDLVIADGWHINAHQPLSEDLIPTRLGLEEEESGLYRLEGTIYPPAKNVRLAFQDEPLAVYEGTVRITAQLVGNVDGDGDGNGKDLLPEQLRLPLELSLQACDDELCLRPETLVLEVPTAHLPRH
jgi:uncharacterized protein YyaL (SSP411 family)